MRTIEECINDLVCDIENFIGGNITERQNELLNEILEIHKAEKRQIGKWINSGIGCCKICAACNAHMGLSNFKFLQNYGADMVGGDVKND